ncbi:MAG: cyclic nucleotide-binding domain-containing protein [Leptospiraceae bacterium]|nr:cyclic nucleotide-binding domain-containing protein [Leptospiraceae bacterium]
MAGPIIRTYKAGSIVYFEKDRAEDIYVLQNGRVILTYMSVDSKMEIKEDVKLGEFFGVKSALGRYPREETAQVIGSASILVFKLADFEVFVANKTHLILKMMKVFSSQLRQIHGKVRENLGQFGDQKSPAFELMNVAEVFHKTGNFEHAVYAYNKYISHYPTGNYASRAQELAKIAAKSSMFPMNMPELVYEMERRPAATVSPANPAATSTRIQALSSDLSIADSVSEADESYESGDYQAAQNSYKPLLTMPPSSPGDDKHLERAYFFYGMSQLKLEQWDAAYGSLSAYVKKYPKGERVKEAIYNLGFVSESKGEKDKAKMLYKKVVSLPPADDFTSKANSEIARLGG